MKDLLKEPKSSEITPEPKYMRRREFIKNMALFIGTAAGVGGALVALSGRKNQMLLIVSTSIQHK